MGISEGRGRGDLHHAHLLPDKARRDLGQAPKLSRLSNLGWQVLLELVLYMFSTVNLCSKQNLDTNRIYKSLNSIFHLHMQPFLILVFFKPFTYNWSL
jgi:hypothetical protein